MQLDLIKKNPSIMSGILSWPSLLGLLLGLDGVLSACTGCPSGWLRNGQACWLVVHEKLYKEAAQERCRRSGGNLAVPTSKAENDYLTSLYSEIWAETTTSLWLGCYATLPDNTLTCYEKLDRNDGFPQMTTSSDPVKRCVILNKRVGTWRAIACDDWRRHVICKLPPRFCAVRCTAVGDTCLQEHTFSTLRNTGSTRCCLACAKDPRCLSFNLSGGTCRLNNATQAQAEGDKHSELKRGCAYYEKETAY